MPYITPEVFMQGRFDDHPRPEWKTAVLCFRDLEGSGLLVQELGARPLGYQVLTGMDEFPGYPYPYAHELAIGEAKVGVIARCGWGGPQTAILVEELAYIGVTKIIGIGAAGSIDHAIPKGSQVVAQAALTTDGTSQAYTDAPELKGDALLCSLALAAGDKLATGIRKVCAVTTDALYRETEAEVSTWRARGGQVVNMETSAFYAASQTCRIRSLWIGHVSDCLVGGEWEEWSDIEEMTIMSARLGLEILTQMYGQAGRENGEA
jgi:purine-nucleoside phosphorylase